MDDNDCLGVVGKIFLVVVGNYDVAIVLGESDEWEYVVVLGEIYICEVSKVENEIVIFLILLEGVSYDLVIN